MTHGFKENQVQNAGWNRGDGDQEIGPIDLALNVFQKKAVKALMKSSGADKNVQRALREISGGEFSSAELEALEDRVLDRATREDVGSLFGIQVTKPFSVSPRQKATIDGLFGKLGGDPLAEKARTAYGRALKNGKVRVR
ncbi:hypothetical protein [Phenylobacterium sp.]|uniref:hypothetical protein n=1 Tax=Phenylobacterium sp. TaxID=1871053 RepID=UPI002719E9AA|nr:hypothetical protein [Phenylobacterium sp.]MDO8379030.1 hypothetical protein [Phenylobacterium sp.]